MKSTKDTHLFKHHPDTLEYVRRSYNLQQPGRIEESVDRLQEWIQAQPHFLKKDFSRDYLEMFIINNKGSVEKAKQRLERQCAIKTFGKKFFCTAISPIDLPDLKNLYSAGLPKLTKDHHRVYILRNVMEYYGPDVVKNYCIQTIFFLECMLKYNYVMGIEIIFDWRKADLMKLLPLMAYEDTRHALEIFLKGYQMRIKKLHIICTSKLIEAILAAVKSVVSPKVLSRVVIHQKLDTLFDHIEKDLLPSDYGGKEKPLIELAADWNKFLSSDEFVAHCNDVFTATIDTAKKPKDEYNDIFFGMAGTFRKIQID